MACLIGSNYKCRATFNHSPNEPVRLAQQWMKEQGMSCMVSSVEFIYLVAHLAWQWMKEWGISCMLIKC